MKADVLKGRLKKIFDNAKKIDAIFLVNTPTTDPNFLYLTGYTSGLYEGDTLISTREKVYHLTSPLEYDTALAQKKKGIRIINTKVNPKTSQRWMRKLIKGKRIGINASFLPISVYKGFVSKYKPKSIVDISGALTNARLIKDDCEIDSIKKAVRITKRAMAEIRKHFKEGMTELELAAKFDFLSMSFGSSGAAFETIVCFGKNTALPHHMPDKTKLKKGEFILIDAGAKNNDYCSDITRTFFFGGKPDTYDLDVYNTVRAARSKALNVIKPGIKGKQVHEAVENFINKAKDGRYKGRFIHSLGHSLGIEVHDGPGFSRIAEQVLKPGMVITVEPGIYIPEFCGVRIEDDILITEKGAVVL
jgi:Xaa-Pro dipeptidase